MKVERDWLFGTSILGKTSVGYEIRRVRHADNPSSTVDTEPITGDVWKMLLGALDPDFDDDSDVEEGEIRKVEREATVGRLSLEPGSSAASVGPATLPYRNTSPIRGPPSAWNRLSGFWGKR